RGGMHGQIVRVYDKEALQAMPPEEINRAVAADLFEDAYAAQARLTVAYKGKALAEHLETALYLCPKCGKIGTLHSRGNRFFCDCGFSVTINELGYFAGTDAPFQTVTQWDAWQTEAFINYCAQLQDAPAFCDRDQTLVRVDGKTHESLPAAAGSIAAYRDRLEIGGLTFAFSDIADMSIYGAMTLTFSTGDGLHYEMFSSYPRSARKYLALYQFSMR
ncbi:MAG: hypothetical protein PHO41_06425, partial [Eubacteriales bacterium]|nr:hypothetical protein [Eubacteriales bacterium]